MADCTIAGAGIQTKTGRRKWSAKTSVNHVHDILIRLNWKQKHLAIGSENVTFSGANGPGKNMAHGRSSTESQTNRTSKSGGLDVVGPNRARDNMGRTVQEEPV